MNESDKIEGVWWVYGTRKPAYKGVLSAGSDGLSLDVDVPCRLELHEVLTGGSSMEFSPVPHIIHGEGEHGEPISLFGCFSQPTISTVKTRHRISPLAAINGIKVTSWKKPFAHCVRLNLEYLHRWFGFPLLERVQCADAKWAVKPPEIEDLVFPISALSDEDIGHWLVAVDYHF